MSKQLYFCAVVYTGVKEHKFFGDLLMSLTTLYVDDLVVHLVTPRTRRRRGVGPCAWGAACDEGARTLVEHLPPTRAAFPVVRPHCAAAPLLACTRQRLRPRVTMKARQKAMLRVERQMKKERRINRERAKLAVGESSVILLTPPSPSLLNRLLKGEGGAAK